MLSRNKIFNALIQCVFRVCCHLIYVKICCFRSMAGDSWVKEYNEAVKLADDINGMISERSSLHASGPETQRHASAIRRKITILGTRLDGLQSILTKLPGKQPM